MRGTENRRNTRVFQNFTIRAAPKSDGVGDVGSSPLVSTRIHCNFDRITVDFLCVSIFILGVLALFSKSTFRDLMDPFVVFVHVKQLVAFNGKRKKESRRHAA